jgi:uncharacterized protein YrzB (UPF0473 family)
VLKSRYIYYPGKTGSDTNIYQEGGFYMSECNCNCSGCGNDHDHEQGCNCDEVSNIIELTGEDGEVINVEFIATIKVDEQEYAIMHSIEESDDGDVIIMRMEKDGDEDYLASIDDDDELERVFEAFKKVAAEDYDFE